MNEADLQIIRNNHVDFLGLNYYSRTLVKPYTEGETTLIVNNTGRKEKAQAKQLSRTGLSRCRIRIPSIRNGIQKFIRKDSMMG